MDDIVEKLHYVLFLLPGFVAFAVASIFGGLPEFGDLYLIFYAVALTILNLAAVALFAKVFRTPSKTGLQIVNFGCAVIIGLLIAIAARTQVVFTVSNYLDLNGVYYAGPEPPLVLLLHQNKYSHLDSEGGDIRPGTRVRVPQAWVRVKLKDGETYEGFPKLYSEEPKDFELYLTPGCGLTSAGGEDNADMLPGPGILLLMDRIDWVELIDPPASSCYRAWSRIAHSANNSP